ncbi:hypothetical protein GCM10010417_20560 [Streptomyces carpaticus]
MKSSLLPVYPGTSSTVPAGSPTGAASSAANAPRRVRSRWARVPGGICVKGGLLTPVTLSGPSVP